MARPERDEERLAQQVASVTEQIRELGLYKPPGVAETIDWAQALRLLGDDDITEAATSATLGTLLKYREDQQRVKAHGIGVLLEAIGGR